MAAGSPGSREYNGYYTWPALGYDGSFPSSKFTQMPEEFQARIKEMVPNAPAGLRFVHVMAAGDDVRKWWRNHGDSSTLQFGLEEGSASWDALTKYVRDKAAATDQSADEFLQHAASMLRMAALLTGDDQPEPEPEVEQGPEFTAQDEKILENVWSEMREMFLERAKEPASNEHQKLANRALVELALDNDAFRHALSKELRRA
jgi:hypothetical protein